MPTRTLTKINRQQSLDHQEQPQLEEEKNIKTKVTQWADLKVKQKRQLHATLQVANNYSSSFDGHQTCGRTDSASSREKFGKLSSQGPPHSDDMVLINTKSPISLGDVEWYDQQYRAKRQHPIHHPHGLATH